MSRRVLSVVGMALALAPGCLTEDGSSGIGVGPTPSEDAGPAPTRVVVDGNSPIGIGPQPAAVDAAVPPGADDGGAAPTGAGDAAGEKPSVPSCSLVDQDCANGWSCYRTGCAFPGSGVPGQRCTADVDCAAAHVCIRADAESELICQQLCVVADPKCPFLCKPLSLGSPSGYCTGN